MRELKFRAWDKTANEFVDDFILDRLGNEYQTDKSEFWGDDRDIVLMQYTGLLDKEGKEIYESDYLGDWCVFWGSGKYILHNISTGDIIDCDETNTINKEINGNSYETPREHKAMASDL